MAKIQTHRADGLSAAEVALYLFLMPLAFTASLHYLEWQGKSLELQVESRVRGDFSRFKYLLADSAEVRKHLLFYPPDAAYTPISKTNEAFNFTMPVLGRREMKIIKGKEESIFRSAEHQQYTVTSADQVVYTLIAEEFEAGYRFSVAQEKNKPRVEFEASLDLFCRTPLYRSVCALFSPWLKASLRATAASLALQAGGSLD